MNPVSQKPEKISEQFAKEIRELFGKEVISIILFGSGATEEYIPKKSDINFLVVLTQQGIEQIEKVHKFPTKWQKRKISLPLFLTEAYIMASLDSFPIEFFNMQAAYKVIYGKDILKGIQIKKEDLRLQCERELKAKLLQLRQGYILTGGKAKALKRLIGQSIVAFASIARGLLYLKGKEIPKTKQEILLSMCREFGLDEGLFSLLFSVRGFGVNLSKKQLASNVQRYISEIEKLSEIVDKMEFVEN